MSGPSRPARRTLVQVLFSWDKFRPSPEPSATSLCFSCCADTPSPQSPQSPRPRLCSRHVPLPRGFLFRGFALFLLPCPWITQAGVGPAGGEEGRDETLPGLGQGLVVGAWLGGGHTPLRRSFSPRHDWLLSVKLRATRRLPDKRDRRPGELHPPGTGSAALSGAAGVAGAPRVDGAAGCCFSLRAAWRLHRRADGSSR